MSYTETMPPPSVELKYPNISFDIVWKRVNSGVLNKTGRNLLYLIAHERSWTKERGFRLNPNIYETPLCPKCHLYVHTQTHKYAQCQWIVAAWEFLRDIVNRVAPDLIFESDHNLLHLCFSPMQRDSAVVWLIGQYLEYVEKESILGNKRLLQAHISGWLSAKLLESRNIGMADLGHIPGLETTGIG